MELNTDESNAGEVSISKAPTKGVPIFDRKSVVSQPRKELLSAISGFSSLGHISKQELKAGKKWVARISCLRCREVLRMKFWSQHITRNCHPSTYIEWKQSISSEEFTNTNRIAKKSAQIPRKVCPHCGQQFSSIVMDLHVFNCKPNDITFGKTELPFVVLPEGNSESRVAFEQYCSDIAKSQRPDMLDWSRIRELELLNPTACYQGLGGWFGYFVYEFAYSDLVVLETPLRNNATYIIGGDWRTIICLTKARIRDGFKDKYVKRVHRGPNWRERVELTLRGNNLSIAGVPSSRELHTRRVGYRLR